MLKLLFLVTFLELKWNLINYNGNKNYKITYSISLFGNLLYNIDYKMGVLIPPGDNKFGCKPLPLIDNLDIVKKNKNKKLSYAWLLVRGNCDFSLKAKYVKASGGILGLVSLFRSEESPKHILAGKNKNNIEILPTIVLISKKDGTAINTVDYQGKLPIIDLNIDLDSHKKNIINFEFWLNPYNKNSYEVLLSIKDNINSWKESINFKPIYKFDVYPKYNKYKCAFTYNYCLFDNFRFDIKEYYYESIFQKSIFSYYYKKNKNIYWSYLKLFNNNCFQDKFNKLEDCRKYIITNFKKSVLNNINKFYINTFKNKNVWKFNYLLVKDQTHKFILFYPTIFIDNILYKEDYSSEVILSAICSLYLNLPNLCKKHFNNSNISYSKVNDFFITIINNWVYLTLFIISIILFIILIIVISKCILVKKIKYNLKEEVDDYISDYLKLKGK